MLNPSRHLQAGFSLIEMMIVLIVMGILLAVIIPNVARYREKASRVNVQQNLKSIKMALEEFIADTGRYPTTLKDLVKKPAEEESAKKWAGPYLPGNDVPTDPWGNKYQYQETSGQENPYELYSYGPKGRKATAHERISVWQ